MEKMNFFDKSSETPIIKDKSDLAQKLNGRVEPAFGIDLGTTNSAISVIINNNKPEPIILTSGKKTMPSCVLWNGSKQGFIVGEEAYKRTTDRETCDIQGIPAGSRTSECSEAVYPVSGRGQPSTGSRGCEL